MTAPSNSPTTCIVPTLSPHKHHHSHPNTTILHLSNPIPPSPKASHHPPPKTTSKSGKRKPHLHYSQYNTNNTPKAHTSPSHTDRQIDPAPQVWRSAPRPSLFQCCALQHRLGWRRRRWQECLRAQARGLGRWMPLLLLATCCFKCLLQVLLRAEEGLQK